MHKHNHCHNHHIENERKTLLIIWLTLLTMIVEIAYGYITKSMALLSDGYHMATHVLALGLTYATYVVMRKFKESSLFPNGTDKIEMLASYTSSLLLAFTGCHIIIEAIKRFFVPVDIKFDDAILIAVIGLLVNGGCIFVMQGSKGHEKHKDYNFKAAYYHILADLLTSVLAIFALIVGKYYGLMFLDYVIGALGGVLILRWAIDLIKNTVAQLIDMKVTEKRI
ncbi:MAG: cation transporter [Alphaproteobacteria bacterium]|nr:cation transporter [Alphaproteobacteria bacterium]